MMQVNSDNVIIDNTWLWRADRTVNGITYNKTNPVATSLQVNGHNVTAYGTMCEHSLNYSLEWNGEDG
jgi:hypothetical protein